MKQSGKSFIAMMLWMVIVALLVYVCGAYSLGWAPKSWGLGALMGFSVVILLMFVVTRLEVRAKTKDDSADELISLKTKTALASLGYRKARDYSASVAILFGAIILYLLTFREGSTGPLPIAGVVISAVLLLLISELAIRYRMRHGIYGTNEYEARQILWFVLENFGSIDFSDGLGNSDLELDSETQAMLDAAWGLQRL